MALCGAALPGAVAKKSAFPSADAFQEVLREKRKGTSMNQMPGHRNKCRKLLWCLGEAKVRQDRAFAAKAVTAVAHPDTGCHHHLVRFAFGCKDVTSRRGILGQVATGKLNTSLQGGDKLSFAFVQSLQEFCTDGFGAPGKTKKPPQLKC